MSHFAIVNFDSFEKLVILNHRFTITEIRPTLFKKKLVQSNLAPVGNQGHCKMTFDDKWLLDAGQFTLKMNTWDRNILSLRTGDCLIGVTGILGIWWNKKLTVYVLVIWLYDFVLPVGILVCPRNVELTGNKKGRQIDTCSFTDRQTNR